MYEFKNIANIAGIHRSYFKVLGAMDRFFKQKTKRVPELTRTHSSYLSPEIALIEIYRQSDTVWEVLLVAFGDFYSGIYDFSKMKHN